MSPAEALAWIETEMVAYYPLGDFKVAEPLQKQGRRGR